MWPFSRQSTFRIPAWQFTPLVGNHVDLVLALGDWYATDGLYAKSDAIYLGHLFEREAFLDTVRSDEDFVVTISFCPIPLTAQGLATSLDIDSGNLFLHCEDAFQAIGAPMAGSRQPLYLIDREVYVRCGAGEDVVLLSDADGCCVAISLKPVYGDGTYRIEFAVAGETQIMKLYLGSSL